MNNVSGRSRHSSHYCSVSADTIASQLVRNGRYAYEDVNRASSRVISQRVSDLWRATTSSPVNISGNFTLRELTVALQRLKPGKAPGQDSICLDLVLHVGAAPKSWLCEFLSSCLRRLKIPKFWRRALVVAIPKSKKRSLRRTQRAIAQYLCFVSPTRSSRGLSIPVWNQLSIPSSLGSWLDFDTGDKLWTKSFC